jgi:DNA repair exonuclease SbcCD ATPase subunit
MVDVTKLRTDERYATLFPPLTADERKDLSDNIKQNGVLTDLIVKDPQDGTDTFIILAGHNRHGMAISHGIKQVPCKLAETVEEMVAALYDNALRRQMDSSTRKKMRSQMDLHIDEMYRERLIPEFFQKYESGEISLREAKLLTCVSYEDQRNLLAKLTVEKKVPLPTKEQEAELNNLKTAHNRTVADFEKQINTAKADLETERAAKKRLEEEKAKADKSLEKLKADNAKADAEVKRLNEEREAKKEELERAMATFKLEKDKLTKEARKAAEEEILNLQRVLDTNARNLREKLEDISQKKEEIRGLNEQIQGMEAKINMSRQAVEAYKRDFNALRDYYSGPGVISSHIVAMQQLAQTLINWAKQHRFSSRTIEQTEEEMAKLQRMLQNAVKQMTINVATLGEDNDNGVDILLDKKVEPVIKDLEQWHKENEEIIKKLRQSVDEAELNATMATFEARRKELQEANVLPEPAEAAEGEGKDAKVINIR